MTDAPTRAPAVLVQHTLKGSGHHTLKGVGHETISHHVSILDADDLSLVAEFEGAKRASDWLRDHHYRYVAGSNGEWTR